MCGPGGVFVVECSTLQSSRVIWDISLYRVFTRDLVLLSQVPGMLLELTVFVGAPRAKKINKGYASASAVPRTRSLLLPYSIRSKRWTQPPPSRRAKAGGYVTLEGGEARLERVAERRGEAWWLLASRGDVLLLSAETARSLTRPAAAMISAPAPWRAAAAGGWTE